MMNLTQLENTELNRYLSWYDFADNLRGTTFLITGSKGIVGTGLIKWLLLENKLHDANVRIIASTRFPEARPDYLEDTDAVSFCKFGEENVACKEKRINFIVHAAAPTQRSFFMTYPVEAIQTVFDETRRMLELATNRNIPMLFLSSEEAYGQPDFNEPITEEYVGAVDSLSIRSSYPLGKKICELLCKAYSVEHGTNVKIIRPTAIQGLFQEYEVQRIESEILRCVLENRDLVMKSNGLTKKCMIYSLDIISAILMVLFKGEKGEAYNATNPDTFMTVKELAEYVFSTFKPEAKVVFAKQDTSIAEGYLPRRSLLPCIRKIEKLGWRPRAGLKHIYEIDIERLKQI